MKNPTFRFGVSIFGKIIVCKIFAGLLDVVLRVVLGGKFGEIATQLLNFGILVAIIYSTAWNKGFADSGKIQSGEIKLDRFCGLKGGLIGSIFEIALAVLLVCVKIFDLPRMYISLFAVFNPVFMPFVLTLMPSTMTSAEIPLFYYIISAATVLIVPLITTISYKLGVDEISLSNTLIYTTEESRAKHKEKAKKRRNSKNRLWRQ